MMMVKSSSLLLIAYVLGCINALRIPIRNNRLSRTELKVTTFDSDTPGVLPPVGFFDPLGLASKASTKDYKKYQEAELKHGRVCMLAAVGILVQENFHPLFGGKIMGASIYHFQEIQTLAPAFWYSLLLAIGIVEGNTIIKGWEPWDKNRSGVAGLRDDYVPGDLGFDPLQILYSNGDYDTNSDTFLLRRTQELQHGRLAMIAAAGFIAQELVDGRPILEHISEFGLRYAPPGAWM